MFDGTFTTEIKLVETCERPLVVEVATEPAPSAFSSVVVRDIEGKVDVEAEGKFVSRLEDELMVATSEVLDLSL